jgi:hypothetical protein
MPFTPPSFFPEVASRHYQASEDEGSHFGIPCKAVNNSNNTQNSLEFFSILNIL